MSKARLLLEFPEAFGIAANALTHVYGLRKDAILVRDKGWVSTDDAVATMLASTNQC